MSINTIVRNSINSIENKIGPYNDKRGYKQRKCDYIEFLALLNTDELYREGLVYKFYAKGEDTLPENNGDIDPEDIKEGLKAELNDRYESEFIDLFNILKYRKNILEDNYPFIIKRNSIKLKPNLSSQHKLYLLLLCCADLVKFEKDMQYKLTDEFEHIIYCALKKLLPNHIIKKLGSNSEYMGNTINKLKELGKDLNIPTYEDQIEEIDIGANKEKGVDLIAWYKFSDNIPNTMIYLVQCACGKDTLHKIIEPDSYRTYFNFDKFKKSPIITLAIPKAVNTGRDHIEQIRDVATKNSLYLDRFRIMELSDNESGCLEILESFKLVEALIDKTVSVLD